MKYFYLLLLLVGCQAYKPCLPEINIPSTWKERLPEQYSFSEKNRFWELFQDPILNELEEEAISANFDLQIAACRILEARSLVLKEYGARLPQADLNASVTQDETLLNPRSFGSSNHLERVKQSQYSLLVGLSYEVDLWGKLKDKEKSAHYRWKASKWEYEFVYQTLVTDVAIHYFSLRTLEEELRFLQKSIDLWKETVYLNECRVQAGLDSEIDLSRTRLELALVEVEIEQTRRQYVLQENALAFLIAKPASSWKAPVGHLPQELPILPNVLPSEILLRRADIQRALALVSAGCSDVNVALKDYFPSFPLTASLGFVSPFLSHFFEWQARYWRYALNVVESLFDGGKQKALVLGAKARFSENFANYQKTVNQAFQDVEDALSTLHYNRLQFEAQQRALTASVETLFLAKEQFNTGLISYLLVADSDNNSIQIARQTIALKGQQITAWIRLMKALGLQKDKSDNEKERYPCRFYAN